MTDHRLSYLKSTLFALTSSLVGALLAIALWLGAPDYRVFIWVPALAFLAASAFMFTVGLGGLLALCADRRERRIANARIVKEAGVDAV